MRSARRDKAGGKADSLGGRLLEMFAKITGDRGTAAKGKAARARGKGRSAKGQVKRGRR